MIQKKKIKYIAICPKCEMFKEIPIYCQPYYCVHSKIKYPTVLYNDWIHNNEPELELLDQIKCKVVSI